MQQHLMQMQPMMATYNTSNVTTDHIQQYLDENKSLILKILDNQNSGKLSECAENQAKLQRNLMYLAAIADYQPQPPTMHAQFPNAVSQPGTHYIMHQQAQQMMPQSLMAARSSMLYAQPLSAMQQQQTLHSQLGMNTGGNNGLHMIHNEGSVGGNGALGSGGFLDFGRNTTGEGLQAASRGVTIASKQDVEGAGPAERRGAQGADGGESLYLKGTELEGN